MLEVVDPGLREAHPCVLQDVLGILGDPEHPVGDGEEVGPMLGEERGVFGARMTGGGFGGCVILLGSTAQLETNAASLAAEYFAATGVHPETVWVHPVAGAGLVATIDDGA